MVLPDVFGLFSNSVGRVAAGASPHVALFAPDGRVALVVNQGPGALSPIEPTSHAVSATLKFGRAPHWLAVSADGRTTDVTNEGSNDVSGVEIGRRRVAASTPSATLHAKSLCSRG